MSTTRKTKGEKPDMRGRAFAAVDPGENSGAAIFNAEGQLVELHQGKRDEVREALRLAWVPLVVEKPQVYPYSKARPNDLITLATYAGMLAAMGPAHVFVLPATWKGQLDPTLIPKRALPCLDEAERGVVRAGLANRKKIDDALDAMALGLWCLGRFDVRGAIR